MKRTYLIRGFVALLIIFVLFAITLGCSGGGKGKNVTQPPGGGLPVSQFGGLLGTVTDLDENPVQGATVRIEGTALSTLTDGMGNFTLTNIPAGTRRLIIDGRTATTRRYTSVIQDVYVVAGSNVTVDLLLKLVQVDTSSEMSIGSGGGNLTNPNIAGFNLDVPAGAVGSDLMFSATQLPLNNLPVALPGDYQPVFAFWIEPEGTILTTPATLTVPNSYGMEQGTRIALFSMTADDSSWTQCGVMEIAAGGGSIVTLSGGIERLPYVVGAILPHIIEGQVLTQATNEPVLGVKVAASGNFIPSSEPTATTDQDGRYALTLVGAAPGSSITLSIDHAEYVIGEGYRLDNPFELKIWGTPVILSSVPSGESSIKQTQNIFVDRVFLSAENVAVGENRNDVEIRTNLTDRDASRFDLRQVSQINVDDLLNLENQVNLVRSEEIASLNVNDALIQNDVIATGKQSRAMLRLSGEQGFIAVDSKSEMLFSILEETLNPRNRTIFATTTNGRFYVDFNPAISGSASNSKLTINTGNALVEVMDATFTFSQIESSDITQSILEVWRGEVVYTDLIRQETVTVAEGDTATIEISAGDFPVFAPKNPRAQAGLREVVVTWDSSIEPNVVGYRVYRRRVGDAAFMLLNQEPLTPLEGDSQSYTDYTIPIGGIEYSYQITAVNILLNESEPSQIAAAIPVAIDLRASSSQAARAVTLTWNDNPNDPDVEGYFIYRSDVFDGTYIKLNANPIPPTADRTGMSYSDDDFTNFGIEYYYYVQVKHTNEWEGGRSTIISASPSAINLFANETPQIRHVQLTWQDPQAENDPDLIGYNVYRRLISESTWTKLNESLIAWSIDGMVFDDFDFPDLGVDALGNPEPRYQYTVRPVRTGGIELTPSDIAYIGPLPIDVWLDNLDRAVHIHWKDTTLDPDCVGYRVWRSQATPEQAVFPNDFTRLNQVPVPVQIDYNGNGLETYGYIDNTVKNFDYTYVITPVQDIGGQLEDLTPSPGIVGSPEFELVKNFYSTGIEFFDENVGFIWGRDGLVIKTIDGGISFEALPVFSADELAALTPDELTCKCGDFINANIGFLLYDRLDGTSYIKRTNSGGDSWETIEINGLVTINDALDPSLNGTYQVNHIDWFMFTSSAAAYAASSDIPIFLGSSNGGIDWYNFGSYPTYFDGTNMLTIYPYCPGSISFYNLENGVAFADGRITKDIDGNITETIPPHLWWYKDGLWNIQNETRMADSIESDAYQFDTLVPLKNQIISASTAVAYSYTGEQLLGFNSFFASAKLEDGYSEIGFSFDFFPSDVEFISFQKGYAIGNGFQNGYILKTSVSGNLWNTSLISPAPFEREYATLSTVGDDSVFAVSSNKLYKTLDAGDTWEERDIQIYN